MDIATILRNNNIKEPRQYYNLIVENLKIDAFVAAKAQYDLMEPIDQNKFSMYVWDTTDWWGLTREQSNEIIHWLE